MVRISRFAPWDGAQRPTDCPVSRYQRGAVSVWHGRAGLSGGAEIAQHVARISPGQHYILPDFDRKRILAAKLATKPAAARVGAGDGKFNTSEAGI